VLEPNALSAFIAVAELGHFVRAADRLAIAQSVVSKRLKRLEDQLGARLIERGKRNRVALTRAGELFLPEARTALAAIERAEQLGRNFARGEAGPVRFGYVFSAIMTGVLPQMIRMLRTDFPELQVEPIAMETPEQLAAIKDGRIDFGLVRPRPTYPEGIAATVVHSEDLIVALSTDHPLARRETVRARDIASQPLIVPHFHEKVGLIDVVTNLAEAGSMPLPEIIRTVDFITAAGLAVAGMGLVVAPRSLTRLALQGLCFRDIADLMAPLDLVLVARAGSLPSIHHVLQACRQ
jgi:DNA-binding transcriptional LysR family regulator